MAGVEVASRAEAVARKAQSHPQKQVAACWSACAVVNNETVASRYH